MSAPTGATWTCPICPGGDRRHAEDAIAAQVRLVVHMHRAHHRAAPLTVDVTERATSLPAEVAR